MWKHVRDRVSIFKHKGEYATEHDLLQLYVYVLLIWGFYRLIFRFPESVEELVLKPLVFLLPVVLRIRTDGKTWAERLNSIGITWKNLFAALAFGLSLGVFYLFVGRMGQLFRFGASAPYGNTPDNPVSVLILALATALSEEILFVGYFLPRLSKLWKDEWKVALAVAIAFASLHVPILIFHYRFPAGLVVGQFLLTFVLGFGNSVLMLRLKNVVAPILSHTLWGIAVLLFR